MNTPTNGLGQVSAAASPPPGLEVNNVDGSTPSLTSAQDTGAPVFLGSAVGAVPGPAGAAPSTVDLAAAIWVCPRCKVTCVLPPPEDRWYAIWSGLQVGWICGL